MTRFICSKDRTEVESVKKELFRAGIRSEIRNNPLAEALRVSRLELWLEDERDLFNASKLYAGMQTRTSGRPADPKGPKQPYIEVNDPEEESVNGRGAGNKVPDEDLVQASLLLEKEIDEIIERESELSANCAALEQQVKQMGESLSKTQAELARENERRTASETKQAEEVSSLKQALAQAQEQLERERRDAQQLLKTRDDAVKLAQKNVENISHQLQVQQAAVVELRKEIVSRETEWEEQGKSASKARAEAVAEREARLAAEERAEKALAARKALEKQVAEQKQQQLHAYAASLNSLRGKLQAKRKEHEPKRDGEV